MKPIELPDAEDDPVTINAQTKTYLDWKKMDVLDGGAAYKAIITFNHSVVAAIMDIRRTTKSQCTSLGKFGNT